MSITLPSCRTLYVPCEGQTYLSLRHDPNSKLDYGVDWSCWLHLSTVTSAAWSVSPDGPTLASDDHDDTGALVWVSGGTVGTTYRLRCSITDTAGRRTSRSIELICRQR